MSPARAAAPVLLLLPEQAALPQGLGQGRQRHTAPALLRAQATHFAPSRKCRRAAPQRVQACTEATEGGRSSFSQPLTGWGCEKPSAISIMLPASRKWS